MFKLPRLLWFLRVIHKGTVAMPMIYFFRTNALVKNRILSWVVFLFLAASLSVSDVKAGDPRWEAANELGKKTLYDKEVWIWNQLGEISRSYHLETEQLYRLVEISWKLHTLYVSALSRRPIQPNDVTDFAFSQVKKLVHDLTATLGPRIPENEMSHPLAGRTLEEEAKLYQFYIDKIKNRITVQNDITSKLEIPAEQAQWLNLFERMVFPELILCDLKVCHYVAGLGRSAFGSSYPSLSKGVLIASNGGKIQIKDIKVEISGSDARGAGVWVGVNSHKPYISGRQKDETLKGFAEATDGMIDGTRFVYNPENGSLMHVNPKKYYRVSADDWDRQRVEGMLKAGPDLNYLAVGAGPSFNPKRFVRTDETPRDFTLQGFGIGAGYLSPNYEVTGLGEVVTLSTDAVMRARLEYLRWMAAGLKHVQPIQIKGKSAFSDGSSWTFLKEIFSECVSAMSQSPEN